MFNFLEKRFFFDGNLLRICDGGLDETVDRENIVKFRYGL